MSLTLPFCLISRLHDVVDRLEVAGMLLRPPGRQREDVVAGLGLRLGGDGQQVLVALRGDVVDLDLDLLLGGPFLARAWWPCWRRAPSGPRSRSRACRRRWRCARTARRSSSPMRSRRRHEAAAAHLGFLHGVSSCCSRFSCLGARDRPSRAKDASRRLCARLISWIVRAGAVAFARASRPEWGYGRRGSMATSAPWRRLQGSSCLLPPSPGRAVRHLSARPGVVSRSLVYPSAIHRPKF